MGNEWLMIVIASALVLGLIVGMGRYLYWRQWDRERRAQRMAARGR